MANEQNTQPQQDGKTLFIFTRSVYGNPHVYLDVSTQERADIANAIQSLTRAKTLLPDHLRALEALGFKFSVVIDPKYKIGI